MDGFTIAFWTDAGGTYMVTQHQRVSVGIQGQVVVRIGDMERVISGAIDPPPGWRFVAVTKAGNLVSIYVNGELDRSEVLVPGITYSSCDSLFLNGDSANNDCDEQDIVNAESTFHSSKMDDLRIFDRALSLSDVRALYGEGGFTP